MHGAASSDVLNAGSWIRYDRPVNAVNDTQDYESYTSVSAIHNPRVSRSRIKLSG